MTIVTTTEDLPVRAPAAAGKPIIVGAALAALAGSTLIGGMLAVWALIRDRTLDSGVERFPVDYIITEVASNVMLMTVWALCFFAVWAIVAERNGDRVHTGISLLVIAVFAIAFINAQAFVWNQMAVPIDDDYYGAMFYAITGAMLALVVTGLIFTSVAAFRTWTGRTAQQHDLMTAHAIFWFFIAVAYSAVWFLVYVTK